MSDEVPTQPELPPVPPPLPIQNPRVEVPPAVYAEGLEVIDGSQPWLDEQQLPVKPAGVQYGMRYKRFRFGGSKDAFHETSLDLYDAIKLWGNKVQYVYLPDHDRGVPLRSLNLYQPLSNQDFKSYVLATLLKRGLLALFAFAMVAFFVFAEYKLSGETITIMPEEVETPEASNPEVLEGNEDEFVMPEIPRNYMFGLFFFMMGLMGGVIPIFDAFIQWGFYPKRKSFMELKQSLVHGSMFNTWIKSTSILNYWPIGLLVLIYTIVYLSQHLAPGDYFNTTFKAAINHKIIRESGEWWRLFTATLMHSNIFVAMHLCFNALALVVLGSLVQRVSSSAMVPILFVVCAFGGAIASVTYLGLVNHFFPAIEIQASLGASGGVLGLLGFLFCIVIARRKHLPYEFRVLIYHNMIRIGLLGLFLVVVIDHGGHLGGFFSGVLCGIIYVPFHRGKWSVPWTPIKTLLVLASFGVVLFGLACCIDIFYFDSQYFVDKLPRIPW